MSKHAFHYPRTSSLNFLCGDGIVRYLLCFDLVFLQQVDVSLLGILFGALCAK
jgi:hypothetical protein